MLARSDPTRSALKLRRRTSDATFASRAGARFARTNWNIARTGQQATHRQTGISDITYQKPECPHNGSRVSVQGSPHRARHIPRLAYASRPLVGVSPVCCKPPHAALLFLFSLLPSTSPSSVFLCSFFLSLTLSLSCVVSLALLSNLRPCSFHENPLLSRFPPVTVVSEFLQRR